MRIAPSLFSFVDNTASSSAFKAERTSPPQPRAKWSSASSSTATSYEPRPLCLSSSARLMAVLICSGSNGCSSKICVLLLIAGLIAWYGLAVVAPIMIIMPFSKYGRRKSCLPLSSRCTSSRIKITCPDIFASAAMASISFLLLMTAFSFRKAMLVLPAIAVAIDVLPMPGAPYRIIDERCLACTIR